MKFEFKTGGAPMCKFEKVYCFYLFHEFPFFGYRETGAYGSGSFHSRHYWLGFSMLFGFRYSVTW